MRKLLTGLAGAIGVAALWRLLTRTPTKQPPEQPPGPDPADELRRKLAEARETEDDRDDYDAAEGTPVDQVVEEPRSLEERRRAVHEQAQEALSRMQQEDED
jgi:hypothetical protein